MPKKKYKGYRWAIADTSVDRLTTVFGFEPYREDSNQNCHASGKWIPYINGQQISEMFQQNPKLSGWCHSQDYRDYRNKRAMLRALCSLQQRFPDARFEVSHYRRVRKTGEWMRRVWSYSSVHKPQQT